MQVHVIVMVTLPHLDRLWFIIVAGAYASAPVLR